MILHEKLRQNPLAPVDNYITSHTLSARLAAGLRVLVRWHSQRVKQLRESMICLWRIRFFFRTPSYSCGKCCASAVIGGESSNSGLERPSSYARPVCSTFPQDCFERLLNRLVD